MAASREVDAVIAIFIPPLPADTAAVARAVRGATATAGPVPVLNVVMSSADPPLEDGDGPRPPRYQFPEDAAHALVRAVEYGSWRQRPEGQVPELPDVRHDEAAALLAAALADGPGPRWLAPEEVARLLACYRLPVAEWRLAGRTRSPGWSSS